MGTRGRGAEAWDRGEEVQEREARGTEGRNRIIPDPQHLGHGLGRAEEASSAGERGRISPELPSTRCLPSHSPGCLAGVLPQSGKQCLLPQLASEEFPPSLLEGWGGGILPASAVLGFLGTPLPPATMLGSPKSVFGGIEIYSWELLPEDARHLNSSRSWSPWRPGPAALSPTMSVGVSLRL